MAGVTRSGRVKSNVRNDDSFLLNTFLALMERRAWWNVRTCEEAKETAMKERNGPLAWCRRGLVTLSAMALLTGSHALAVTPPTIGIKEFKFAPPVLTVRPGTTVTWVNHDEETHTVTSATGAFGSAGLVNEDTFAQTFTKPGTYQYFCAIHPRMKATVVVK
jgi:plastocyanin